MTRPEPAEECANGAATAAQQPAEDAYVIRCSRKTFIEEWDGRLLGMECTPAQAAALEQRVLAAAQQADFALLHEGYCLATLLPTKGGQLRVLEGMEAANQRAEEVWQELQRLQQVPGGGGSEGEQVRPMGCVLLGLRADQKLPALQPLLHSFATAFHGALSPIQLSSHLTPPCCRCQPPAARRAW